MACPLEAPWNLVFATKFHKAELGTFDNKDYRIKIKNYRIKAKNDFLLISKSFYSQPDVESSIISIQYSGL